FLAIDLFCGRRKDLDDELGIGNPFLIPYAPVARDKHIRHIHDLIGTRSQLDVTSADKRTAGTLAQIRVNGAKNILGDDTMSNGGPTDRGPTDLSDDPVDKLVPDRALLLEFQEFIESHELW